MTRYHRQRSDRRRRYRVDNFHSTAYANQYSTTHPFFDSQFWRSCHDAGAALSGRNGAGAAVGADAPPPAAAGAGHGRRRGGAYAQVLRIPKGEKTPGVKGSARLSSSCFRRSSGPPPHIPKQHPNSALVPVRPYPAGDGLFLSCALFAALSSGLPLQFHNLNFPNRTITSTIDSIASRSTHMTL